MDEDLKVITDLWQHLTEWQRKKIVFRARWYVFSSRARRKWQEIKQAAGFSI